jgi:hypothetical protein
MPGHIPDAELQRLGIRFFIKDRKWEYWCRPAQNTLAGEGLSVLRRRPGHGWQYCKTTDPLAKAARIAFGESL